MVNDSGSRCLISGGGVCRHHYGYHTLTRDRPVCRVPDRKFEGYLLSFSAMLPSSSPWDTVTAHASVLLYGCDAVLLRTRCWILEGAGFQIWTTMWPLEVEQILGRQHIDLFILCYTLSTRQCEDAVARAKMLQPRTKTMILSETSSSYLKGEHDEVVSTVGNPELLIATAKRMVTPAASIEIPPSFIRP